MEIEKHLCYYSDARSQPTLNLLEFSKPSTKPLRATWTWRCCFEGFRLAQAAVDEWRVTLAFSANLRRPQMRRRKYQLLCNVHAVFDIPYLLLFNLPSNRCTGNSGISLILYWESISPESPGVLVIQWINLPLLFSASYCVISGRILFVIRSNVLVR